VLTLVIDTSSAAVTAGIVDVSDSVQVLSERVTVNGRAHGELLAPSIGACLSEIQRSPHDLQAIVVGTGPGPFTGLRVGLVTAASMADALDIPAYGVCSLDGIAAAVNHPGPLFVAGDARRKEVYWARYLDGARDGSPQVTKPADVAVVASAMAGAGARLYRDQLGLALLDQDFPGVAGLARVVADRVRQGSSGEPLTPLYLRRPDATPPASALNGGEPGAGDIRIRPMTPADLDAILPFEAEMFGSEAWSRAAYLDEINDVELRRYLVAESSCGEVLGDAGVLIVADTAQVVTIAVVPTARRRGIARRLLTELIAIARSRRAIEILLEVRVDNMAAQKLYETEGFSTVGIRKGYYDRGRVDAKVMRLDLR